MVLWPLSNGNIYIYWGSLRGVVANLLSWDSVLSEFELYSSITFSFGLIFLEKVRSRLSPKLWFKLYNYYDFYNDFFNIE